MNLPLLCAVSCVAVLAATSAEPFKLKRCEIIPLPENQASFRIDGVEKLRWHYGREYTRPFFYPFNGPAGVALTRMGHPGAQNHDHHKSVWLAHAKLNGNDYWSENGKTQVRQKLWYGYMDGDEEAIMGSWLGWYGPDGTEEMEMDLVAALIPLPRNEHAVELQLSVRPPKKTEKVELEKTNFGFLAVRVAKTIAAHFGGGTISSSEGWVGEPNIFGKASRWMDYSGPIAVGSGPKRRVVTEGITYFDHPQNVNYPAKWHVREDGWMGASVCRDEGLTATPEKPLTFRYLLYVHSGGYNHKRADAVQKAFVRRPGFSIGKRSRKHRQYEVWRKEK